MLKTNKVEKQVSTVFRDPFGGVLEGFEKLVRQERQAQSSLQVV